MKSTLNPTLHHFTKRETTLIEKMILKMRGKGDVNIASIIFLLFLCFSVPVYAIARPFPGYYINKNGDTVFCDFKFNDSRITPDQITIVSNNKTETFFPEDVKGFGVFEYGNYISAIVSYHPGVISGVDLPDKYSDKTETRTRFLKVLISGTYSLYEMITTQRPYFFIQKNNENPEELLYRVKRVQTEFTEDRRYRNRIYELFTQEGIVNDYVDRITTASYKSSDLERLVNILNSRHPESYPKVANKKRMGSVEGEIYGGASLNNFLNEIPGHFDEAIKVRSTISPTAGFGVIYFTPGHFNSLGIGVALSYTSFKGNVSKSNTDYNDKFSVNNSVISANVYLVYLINPHSRTKFYGKLGFAYNILSKKISVTDHYSGTNPPIEGEDVIGSRSSIYSAYAGFGVSFNRHRFEINCYTPMDLNAYRSNYVVENGPFKVQMISATYHFTVFSSPHK